MKKLLSLGLVLILAIMLTGCGVKKEETSTTGEPETMLETVSPDDSLETIQEELDQTEVSEFDQDLKAIDQDINQL